MNRLLLLVSLVAAALPLAAIAAEQPKPLSGSFYFRGKTPVDPPPSEARDTHMLINLEGMAARELYDKMKVRAIRDQCLDDGSLTKAVGDMQCTKLAGNKGYSCHFSINVPEQRIEVGLAC
jgi:hypothetical protein